MENRTTGAPPVSNGHHADAAPSVLSYQRLLDALRREWIRPTDLYRIPVESVQPGSIDLRLGPDAWALSCSFLPDKANTVERKLTDVAFPHKIDLRDGAILERNRPYLVPLIEELHLPEHLRAKANPKSSTGRLDVFTRVISDHNHRFDEVRAGYKGPLYLEIVPRSFAIHVKTGLALNQLRLVEGEDARLRDSEVRSLHAESPLLYVDERPVPDAALSLGDGLFLSVDLSPGRIAGFRAKTVSMPLDLSLTHHYRWQDYWEAVWADERQRIVLEPDDFYLLLSAEGVAVPPEYAAEMMAYDPTAGELRTHYAGFFDPGFGYDPRKRNHGSRAALEVRARDVAFMVEHGQPICKLAFERMSDVPERLYGEDLGSNYQGQTTMLSKHFTDQTAGVAQMTLRPVDAPPDSDKR